MKNSKVSFTTNQKIIHHLMLESNQLKSLGLLDGKMGLIIFFYHYARHTDNIIFEDFADDLLDGLLENIHKELPLTFTSGLSGIAWGIEYLIQNRFIEGDSNEICEELDKKIISADPRHLEDYSLETGLEGIAHCVIARINGAIRQNNPISFDRIS
ncbi:MAG: hypothetical protein LBL58_09645 [Tannerellaceae bacterium]|jgi:lantibiotic modifying enzyme|nr:hypothetical protein [Tannerellaceae bacterium]